LDGVRWVVLTRVYRELGAEIACDPELVIGQIDRDHASPRDRGVLGREVTTLADAEHGN
jgi:hypothetical protein